MSCQPTHHPNTRIFPASLDPHAVDVVTRLTKEGFEAYLVGGCVRDLLLGHIPKDFDVSTEARPRQIRRVFRNCRVIGRRFKLAHVHFGEKIIEVATFRQNPTAENAGEKAGEDEEIDTDALLIVRDNVFGTAEEDSVRRDFTINALLYDVNSNEVIDYVGGFEDIENKILRTIGEPSIRFAEDPVRMLRAIKFTSRLDLTLEASLKEALHSCAELIENSSPARVIEEIFKLLACGRSEQSLAMLLDYGLLQRLLPELADYWADHRDDLVSLGKALDFVDGGKRRVSNAYLLAVLFHDPFRDLVAEQEGGDAMVILSDLVAPAALRTSIPRRDVAHMKHMLVTQLRLERNRRGRRFRMSEFLERPSTHEAIDLLYLRSLAGAIDGSQHAEWALRLATHLGDKARPGNADEQRRSSRPPRKSRRHRTRGGRSGQGRRSSQDDRSSRPPRESREDSAERPPRSRRADTSEVTEAAAKATAPGPATPPSVAPAQPATDQAASVEKPGGFKGLVRSFFRKVLNTEDSSTTSVPQGQEPLSAPTAANEPPQDTSAVGESQSASSASESADSARDGDSHDGEDPSRPPRKRRRRRRRRRPNGANAEGAEAGTSTESTESSAATEERGASRDSGESRPASKRRRRSRGGRDSGRRQGSQSSDKADDSRASSSSSRSGASKSKNSRGRSGSSSRGDSRSSRNRDENPRDMEPRKQGTQEDSTSQRHPEDIEDTFDW